MDNMQQHYKTKQETIIISFFQNNEGNNFSADEVYNNICSQGISRATVYRRLERLVEDGTLVKLPLGSGNGAKYRLCGEKCKNTSHFVCTSCNCVEHIDCHLMPELSEHLKNGHGLKIDSAKTVFYGLCERCCADEI